jgi:hypothetical protein
MKDICAPSSLAVVDKIVPSGEALHALSDVVCGSARIWMFSKQPESLGDPVDYTVCNLQTCPARLIQKNLLQVPLRILRDTVAHYLLEA